MVVKTRAASGTGKYSVKSQLRHNLRQVMSLKQRTAIRSGDEKEQEAPTETVPSGLNDGYPGAFLRGRSQGGCLSDPTLGVAEGVLGSRTIANEISVKSTQQQCNAEKTQSPSEHDEDDNRKC